MASSAASGPALPARIRASRNGLREAKDRKEWILKLVTWELREASSPKRFLGALLTDDVLVDLGAAQSTMATSGKTAVPFPGEMIAFLAAGEAGLTAGPDRN